MAGLDERRPVHGGLLRAAPGVPLVGVPGGDPEHARAAGAHQDGQRRLGEDGVLEGEGSLGSALPKASEQENEEPKLGEQEGRPDSWLREHMHRSAGAEDNG